MRASPPFNEAGTITAECSVDSPHNGIGAMLTNNIIDSVTHLLHPSPPNEIVCLLDHSIQGQAGSRNTKSKLYFGRAVFKHRQKDIMVLLRISSYTLWFSSKLGKYLIRRRILYSRGAF